MSSFKLRSYQELITPREKTRSGFISVALEKNRQATPFIEEAKVFRSMAKRAKKPMDLLNIPAIRPSLLTASGVSAKAKSHLNESDHQEAIKGLIDNFLDPAGDEFVDELVYRFLLTKGDALGGIMRNLAGAIGEWKFTSTLISTMNVKNTQFHYLDKNSKKWLAGCSRIDLEKCVKGLTWKVNGKPRTLLYNLTVPAVKKNVDLCLLDCDESKIIKGKKGKSAHEDPDRYLALGELKGGIDPAGADEHWKTARTALDRIRIGFSKKRLQPNTFFVGAAIEKAMAEEIFHQVKQKTLTNAANLTDEDQVVALSSWLTSL